MPNNFPSSEIHFGRSVFICSKPLQALHCTSIARANGIQDAELHIVTAGIHEAGGFREFFESSCHSEPFSRIGWHLDHSEAVAQFSKTDYESIFIEDDRFSMYHLFAPLKRRYLSLFEEGIGTYNGPHLGQLTGLRRLKWKMLARTSGSGMDFGGGRATDFVFVQFPSAYGAIRPHLAHKARAFPGLLDEISRDLDAWEALASPSVSSPHQRDLPAVLFLGTWGTTMADYPDLACCDNRNSFFKAHPHSGEMEEIYGARLISASWVPAEVFVGVLARNYPTVTVVHHASSVEFNTRNQCPNVSFIDVADDEFADWLRQLVEMT